VAINAGTDHAIAKNSFFHLQSPFHLLKIDEKTLAFVLISVYNKVNRKNVTRVTFISQSSLF
ncbi:MAG: hypothetical protein IKE47_05910, partial [Oscillospiraceae bacterium]|nr:hypothetical protein [Oscillospiraceae bacterium]